MSQSFDHLSPLERAVVGDPQDYDWDNPITPEPARPARGQFSMRVDPELYADLAAAAAARGVRFSEIVREALETFVGRRQAPTGSASYSIGHVEIVRVTDSIHSWSTPTRSTEPERVKTRPEVLETATQ